MAKKLMVRATLSREFEVQGELDETTQGDVSERFIQEAAAAPHAAAKDMEFEVLGEETVEGGRGAREVMEEWQGVCSEQLDDKALLDALAIFIDKQGKAAQLDDFLRALAEEGMSDPAAE